MFFIGQRYVLTDHVFLHIETDVLKVEDIKEIELKRLFTFDERTYIINEKKYLKMFVIEYFINDSDSIRSAKWDSDTFEVIIHLHKENVTYHGIRLEVDKDNNFGFIIMQDRIFIGDQSIRMLSNDLNEYKIHCWLEHREPSSCI